MVKEVQPNHKVWLDGAIVAPEHAKISIFTETAMRGANVYEGIAPTGTRNFAICVCGTSTRTSVACIRA